MPGLDLDNNSEFVTTCTMIGITQLRVSTRTTYLMWPSYCCLDINTIEHEHAVIHHRSCIITHKSAIADRNTSSARATLSHENILES